MHVDLITLGVVLGLQMFYGIGRAKFSKILRNLQKTAER
jgi:hypothetical protein